MSDTPKSSSVDDDDDDVGSSHDSDAGTAGVEGGTVLDEVEVAEDGEPKRMVRIPFCALVFASNSF
jgi:hypothetical protein